MSEELPLQGKVAVITGASSGVGKAAALSWAALGADVVICARTAVPQSGVSGSLAETKDAVEALGRRCISMRVDISDERDIERLAEETFGTFDHVDILLNSAAALESTGMNASFWDMTPAEWLQQVSVNLTGQWLMMKAFVPSMRTAGGLVINVTSGHIPGQPLPTGLPGAGYPGAAYLTTKAGLDRMTADLAKELRSFNIAVVSFHPGSAKGERSESKLKKGGYDLKYGIDRWRPMEEAVVPSLRWLVTLQDPLEYSGTVLYAPLLIKDHSLV